MQTGANYLLAVNINQKMLESIFNDFFRLEILQAYDGDKYSTQETEHGGTETRLAIVNHDMSILDDTVFEWPDLTTMGVVAVIRQEGDEVGESMSVRFYISSAKLSA